MALTRREQAIYDKLRAKRRTASPAPSEGRRRPREEDDGEDGVFVLSGKHATSFLDRMFGSDSNEPDDDDDEYDDDDEDDAEEDPEPPAGNRFFRGRR